VRAHAGPFPLVRGAGRGRGAGYGDRERPPGGGSSAGLCATGCSADGPWGGVRLNGSLEARLSPQPQKPQL